MLLRDDMLDVERRPGLMFLPETAVLVAPAGTLLHTLTQLAIHDLRCSAFQKQPGLEFEHGHELADVNVTPILALL